MFKIGEFSRVAQIATSQLRYYDRIGLFQPGYTDEFTGYRYYQAAQLPDLNRILAMKELGLSLEQIQELVQEDVSAEALRGMLALKKAQVREELHNQITRLHHIEARLQQVEQAGDTNQADVVLKELPSRLFYGFRATLPDLRQVRGHLFESHNLIPSRISKKKLSYLTVMQHQDSFTMKDADVELGFLINEQINDSLQLSSGHEFTTRTLPSVEMAACIVRVGGPDQSYGCYANAGHWIEANGYQIIGPAYEVFLVPPRPKRISETVCEIQIPVVLSQRRSLVLD